MLAQRQSRFMLISSQPSMVNVISQATVMTALFRRRFVRLHRLRCIRCGVDRGRRAAEEKTPVLAATVATLTLRCKLIDVVMKRHRERVTAPMPRPCCARGGSEVVRSQLKSTATTSSCAKSRPVGYAASR